MFVTVKLSFMMAARGDLGDAASAAIWRQIDNRAGSIVSAETCSEQDMGHATTPGKAVRKVACANQFLRATHARGMAEDDTGEVEGGGGAPRRH
jgi:hypothetical protein